MENISCTTIFYNILQQHQFHKPKFIYDSLKCGTKLRATNRKSLLIQFLTRVKSKICFCKYRMNNINKRTHAQKKKKKSCCSIYYVALCCKQEELFYFASTEYFVKIILLARWLVLLSLGLWVLCLNAGLCMFIVI